MTADDLEVDHWRNRLNAIDRMLAEVPDTMLTISSYAMDLAGPAASAEPPLPGGDALVLTGPWAPDATVGDDTPHPSQTIIEWAHTIWDAHGQIPPERLRFAQALVYVREQVPWILDSPWADAWCEDINAVHGRLRSLCPPEVDDRHDSRPQATEIAQTLAEVALLIPDDRRLRLSEFDRAWPDLNLSQRIRTARSKENARARRRQREPQHRIEPDQRGRYRVGDVRGIYPDTRESGTATG